MKTLSSTFRAEASGDANRPVELYDIFLDDATLNLINYDKNITFFDLDGNSQAYTAFPISREGYERTVENPINSIRVSVANVDRSMSAYLASGDFRGRRIVIRKIFADQLTASGDASLIFDGVMDMPSASEDVIQINAVDRIGSLRREAPRGWYQLMCNWKFGDDQCFYGQVSGDMYATARYTCFSGCTVTQLNSSSLTQADDYWIDGEVEMTDRHNAGQKRKITTSDSSDNTVNLGVSLPYIPASGDTFTIRRGCDKTHLRCSGDFSNDVNFGGFDTIPEQMTVR